jgi:hypothetical protein
MQKRFFTTTAMAALMGLGAVSVVLAQAPAPAAEAQAPAAAKGDPAKAQDVLKAVGKAQGGDKLAKMTTFTAEGEYRRVMGEREMTGGLEIAGQVPDAFQVTQQFMRPDGMAGPSMSQTIKGAEAFRDMTGMGGGGGFMMRMAGGGPGGPGGAPGAPGAPGAGGPGGQNRQDPAVQIKAELYRTLLGIMPTSAVLSGLTFTHVAEAEAPNGVADVIDVTGPDNFRARLFVDQAEHRPLMLSYMMRQPRMRQMTPPPQFKNDEERRAYFEEQRKKFEAEPPPPLVEANVFYSDYKKVDGVMLPHKITRQVEGKVQEEWTIEKYKLNVPLKAEQFQKKSSN